MPNIAKRLGLTANAVYRYVSSREELLVLLAETAWGPAPALDTGTGRWRAARRMDQGDDRTMRGAPVAPRPAPPRGTRDPEPAALDGSPAGGTHRRRALHRRITGVRAAPRRLRPTHRQCPRRRAGEQRGAHPVGHGDAVPPAAPARARLSHPGVDDVAGTPTTTKSARTTWTSASTGSWTASRSWSPAARTTAERAAATAGASLTALPWTRASPAVRGNARRGR
ncbi:hypothetical protein AB7952_00200 [Streptomyces sp. PG2]